MTNWKAVTISLGLAVGWIMGNPAVALGPAPEPQAEVQMNIALNNATVVPPAACVVPAGVSSQSGNAI